MAVHDAYSGVQCRHLCQAHETCAYWTYIVNAPQVPDSLQGRCFLKSSLATANRELAHPFVVSGERLCAHFAEGLSAEAARARLGLQSPVWRTSVHKATAGLPGLPLLPGSGTEEWYREATKVLDEVGFATGSCSLAQFSVHCFSPKVEYFQGVEGSNPGSQYMFAFSSRLFDGAFATCLWGAEVVILDALSDAQTAELLHKAKQAQLQAQQLSSSVQRLQRSAKCLAHKVAEKMLLLDPERLGNRGPRRYSFGGASRTLHLMQPCAFAAGDVIPLLHHSAR